MAAAVAHEGVLLAHAPPALRADREVCLVAVLHDGRALEFAASSLQDDKALVLMAVRVVGGGLAGLLAQRL